MLLFYKFANYENRVTRVVSDSAYTVYLFHQALVVLVAIWLARHMTGAPALLKYSIVVATVLLVTIAAHQLLIARRPLLRFLFNGRMEAPARKSRASLAQA